MILLKKVKSLLYRLFVKSKQKYYKINGKKIKYLFFKNNNSKKLIICFSAFPGEGNGASKYNYIKTLNWVNASRLYILDDFGYENVGTYYLGENGILNLDKCVINLIYYISNKYELSKFVTLGSSKGGTAAVYFGTLINAEVVIAGAPQYFIGKYLCSNDYNKKILKGILGDNYTDNQVLYLDNVVKNAIFNSSNKKMKYIINFSKNEHTYDEHIKYLINDLKKSNKNIICEESDYSIHSDVGNVMPNLFKKYLS